MDVSKLMIIKIAIMAFKIIVPIIAIIFVVSMNWRDYFASIARETETNISNKLKKSKGYFNYTKIAEDLKKHGIEYMFGDAANPFVYLMVKLFFAILVLAVGISLGTGVSAILLGIVLGIVGFFAPDIVVRVINDVDNDEMMSDIKAIFDTLKIQTKSGVYLSYSLCECYMIVENPRLKRALLDMTSDIIAKNQIEPAVNEFNSKFENPYIDTLCVTIIQSMESGKSAQILEDLSTQISDMQRAVNIKEKEALDRKVQLFEILIFTGLVGMLIYVMGLSVFNQMMTF